LSLLGGRYARFYVIKSYSEDDVHKSIKYGVWASTDTGNRRLDAAYRESCAKGPIYLFFSVNASGQFSGLAQMESALDYTKKFGSWGQDKWNGTFQIKWTYIKDIPNNQFRHIVLANNENKPVTNSRDTQEIMLDQGARANSLVARRPLAPRVAGVRVRVGAMPASDRAAQCASPRADASMSPSRVRAGREMLRLFATYRSRTSILDDFSFYDKRQELMEARMIAAQQQQQSGMMGQGGLAGGAGGAFGGGLGPQSGMGMGGMGGASMGPGGNAALSGGPLGMGGMGAGGPGMGPPPAMAAGGGPLLGGMSGLGGLAGGPPLGGMAAAGGLSGGAPMDGLGLGDGPMMHMQPGVAGAGMQPMGGIGGFVGAGGEGAPGGCAGFPLLGSSRQQ
jgi:hypothetical protein